MTKKAKAAADKKAARRKEPAKSNLSTSKFIDYMKDHGGEIYRSVRSRAAYIPK